MGLGLVKALGWTVSVAFFVLSLVAEAREFLRRGLDRVLEEEGEGMRVWLVWKVDRL